MKYLLTAKKLDKHRGNIYSAHKNGYCRYCSDADSWKKFRKNAGNCLTRTQPKYRYVED